VTIEKADEVGFIGFSVISGLENQASGIQGMLTS
jgi:hypothetical protein